MDKNYLINLCVLNEAAYVLARTGQCVLPEGFSEFAPIEMPLQGCPDFLTGDCLPTWGFTTKGPDNKIYIVFRGTQLTTGWKFGQEWAEDLLSLPLQPMGIAKVHCGFYQAWKALRTPLLYAIAKQHPTIDSSYVFTGHSLGAAIASLFFVSEHNSRPADLVTFGCPRVGDSGFSNYLYWLPTSYRVVNAPDVVPKVPTDPPFRHGGKCLTVHGPGSVEDLKLAHSLESYKTGVENLGELAWDK